MRDIAFQVPGSAPVDSLFGERVKGSVPYGMVEGSQLSDSTAPYLGRGNLCSANGDTCEARRVTGEELCIGHLRSSRKAQAASVRAEESVSLDGHTEGVVRLVGDQ